MMPAFCASSPVLTSIRQGGRRPLCSISLRQGLREPRPVDALDHIEDRHARRAPCWSAAGRSGAARGREIPRAAAGYFACASCTRFSPKTRWPASSASRTARGRMGLADRDECHALRRAVRRPRRRRDPLPDGGEIGRDNPFHSSSIPGKDRAMSVLHYRASARSCRKSFVGALPPARRAHRLSSRGAAGAEPSKPPRASPRRSIPRPIS